MCESSNTKETLTPPVSLRNYANRTVARAVMLRGVDEILEEHEVVMALAYLKDSEM